MESLEHKRHTLAHLLAMAAKEFDPGVNMGIGPVTDDGFYYDFQFTKAPTESDLKSLEQTMLKSVHKKLQMTGREITKAEGEVLFQGQPFKLELLAEYAGADKTLTAYTVGDFTDLCKGGHTENTGEIDPGSFTLSRIAGAYWRGDQKNPMLTRIYGLAFETKADLEEHLRILEEAKKRDHRKLGKELGLFAIIDEIGAGLPLFYPKGATLRKNIENFISELQKKRGYQDIWIPHITKGTLYEISGHLDKYDAMYTPMKIDDHDYYVKPMNCPHFMMLYKTLPHSYREMPVRYTCTTTNYRYEKSGELSGLTRVRSLTQDDCHVFARPDQIETEIDLMLDMIRETYAGFGLSDFYVRISLRDSTNKEKYIGSDAVWNTAENALRSIVKKTGWKYTEAEDEAAFYGPKLDFMFKDAIGRQWQLSTIQLDFNLPERFELDYITEANEKERPVVIHRAVLGSTERFMGVMIEHFAGSFPVWLSPVQVKVLPISEKYAEYAQTVVDALEKYNISVELDCTSESLGKRIRIAKTEKVPYILVLGEKEVDASTVTVERRDGKQATESILDFVNTVKGEIEAKEIW